MDIKVNMDGSLTLPPALMKSCGLEPGTMVEVYHSPLNKGQFTVNVIASSHDGFPASDSRERNEKETQTFDSRPEITQDYNMLSSYMYPSLTFDCDGSQESGSGVAAAEVNSFNNIPPNNSNAWGISDNSDFWNTSNPFPSVPPTFHSNGGSFDKKQRIKGSATTVKSFLNLPSPLFSSPLKTSVNSASTSSRNEMGFFNNNKSMAATKVSSEKRRRKRRDPTAPKRNVSAYSIYTKFISKQLIAENPDMDFTERGHLIGAKWKSLSEEGKKPFIAAAAIDRQRYLDECAEFEKNNDNNLVDNTLNQPASLLQPPILPIVTKNGSNRNNLEHAFPVTNSLLPNLTNGSNDNVAYQPSENDSEEVQGYLTECSDYIQPKRSEIPLVPKKRVSAFGVFTKEMTPQILQESPSLPLADRSRIISQRWRSMREEDKLPYQQLAEMDRVRFERELEEYFKDCKSKNIPIRCQRWLREARMKPLESFNLLESQVKDSDHRISPGNSSNSNSIFGEESHEHHFDHDTFINTIPHDTSSFYFS